MIQRNIIKILVGVLVVLMLATSILYIMYRVSEKEVARGRQNTQALIKGRELWKTKYNQSVVTTQQINLTYAEFKRATDESIASLRRDNSTLGNKLRKTEYLLSISTGFRIDTVVTVDYSVINDTTILQLDSLRIESFFLKRVQNINLNYAKYYIEYKPRLTVAIEWYKEPAWRPINIIKWRKKLYQVDVMSSDTLLKPTSATLIKLGKRK